VLPSLDRLRDFRLLIVSRTSYRAICRCRANSRPIARPSVDCRLSRFVSRCSWYNDSLSIDRAHTSSYFRADCLVLPLLDRSRALRLFIVVSHQTPSRVPKSQLSFLSNSRLCQDPLPQGTASFQVTSDCASESRPTARPPIVFVARNLYKTIACAEPALDQSHALRLIIVVRTSLPTMHALRFILVARASCLAVLFTAPALDRSHTRQTVHLPSLSRPAPCLTIRDRFVFRRYVPIFSS
jgi:hypothetical protein